MLRCCTPASLSPGLHCDAAVYLLQEQLGACWCADSFVLLRKQQRVCCSERTKRESRLVLRNTHHLRIHWCRCSLFFPDSLASQLLVMSADKGLIFLAWLFHTQSSC